MAKLNKPSNRFLDNTNHEGAPAKRINYELQLRRSIMSCLLWENSFYESGESIADRITELVSKVDPLKVSMMAIEARTEMKLRHVPLLIVRAMARIPSCKPYVAATIVSVIQRADELTELLAIYWKKGHEKLSAQVKKGLAKAFTKFSEYDLAKYNQDGPVKLRDVLFLCHAKPLNSEQAEVWKRLIDGKLQTPDTWETNLSAGKDKKETWTRLINEKKLGGLALIRNLRNMNLSGVDRKLVKQAINEMKVERVIPFRFITAARHNEFLEPELEQAMLRGLEGHEKLKGETILLVDVSGSMNYSISGKSEVMRMDCACGLAVLCREICESVRVFAFSDDIKEIAPRRGFALRDAIVKSMPHGRTDMGDAISHVNTQAYDRLIVFTDEQSHQAVGAPKHGLGYVINVSSDKNGVGYGAWTHIDGFSESTIKYIIELEKLGKDE